MRFQYRPLPEVWPSETWDRLQQAKVALAL